MILKFRSAIDFKNCYTYLTKHKIPIEYDVYYSIIVDPDVVDDKLLNFLILSFNCYRDIATEQDNDNSFQ